jgi:hypothetical protein
MEVLPSETKGSADPGSQPPRERYREFFQRPQPGEQRKETRHGQDILYIHYILEAFAPRMAELWTEWLGNVRPHLHTNNARE